MRTRQHVAFVPVAHRAPVSCAARVSRRSPVQRRSRTSRASRDGGWTLIEMLVVLSLIMILSSLALTTYRNSILTAKEASLRSDLFQMRDAIDQYYADKGKYPESLEALVSEHYIRAIPKDPITNATDTWQTVPAERDAGAVSSSAGIYDVKSGSSDTAIDGSNYQDW
jgi:general secretion pathway protein G